MKNPLLEAIAAAKTKGEYRLVLMVVLITLQDPRFDLRADGFGLGVWLNEVLKHYRTLPDEAFAGAFERDVVA